MKKIVNTKNAPAPIGPYNHCVVAGNLVYTSGQIPLSAQTGDVVEGSVEEQTKQVLENLKAVLEEAGSSLANVVKTTVFIKNMSDFPKINEVYGTYFEGETAPARSTVEVARLPKDVLVEIEAVAHL